MMSNIKDRRRENNDDKLSEYSQNTEIVVRQKSYATFEKTIQLETKNDNEKIFNHDFSENDVVDYTALIEKKRARNKNLKVKRKYHFFVKKE